MNKMTITWMSAVAISFAAIATASAQRNDAAAVAKEYVPVDQTIVCRVAAAGEVALALDDGTSATLSADASGDASFTSVANAADGNERNDQLGLGDVETKAQSTFSLNSITITGTDPVYGTYTFTADAERQPQNSTVVANQAGALYPATADIYANVTGTISGLAGTFTNSNTCHMQTTNLSTFNPQVNESYSFVDDVVFSNGNGTSFTIPAGTTVTLN